MMDSQFQKHLQYSPDYVRDREVELEVMKLHISARLGHVIILDSCRDGVDADVGVVRKERSKAEAA
jgi:hypothetical protein